MVCVWCGKPLGMDYITDTTDNGNYEYCDIKCLDADNGFIRREQEKEEKIKSKKD